MLVMKKTVHQYLDSFREKGNLKALKKAALVVHEKYAASPKPLSGREEHVAYMLYRMPATYAAVGKALSHLKQTLPGFAPKTVLDLGSGPGTALLAALESFPCVERAVGLEQSDHFVDLSHEFFAFFQETRAEVHSFSLEKTYPDTPCDLVIASYAFNELQENTVAEWIVWAKKNAKVLLIVEPGTPACFEKMLRARSFSAEGLILAPCPHALSCPMQKERKAWCHEMVRLPRTFIHKYMKEGSLGYEDEKFCYLAVLFDKTIPATVPPCRIVNTPRHRSGHTYLSMCTQDGTIGEYIVSRKRKELYALAKRARWGDSFPSV